MDRQDAILFVWFSSSAQMHQVLRFEAGHLVRMTFLACQSWNPFLHSQLHIAGVVLVLIRPSLFSMSQGSRILEDDIPALKGNIKPISEPQ